MNNFNNIINEHEDVITTFKGKTLILKDMQTYDGPITMQYLPSGGIQSTYNYHLIINTLKGFMFCDILIYDDKKMSSKQFIEMFPNIVNEVLPN